ncbi:MAG: YbaN family protein [Burkholderiaceae bacterium]
MSMLPERPASHPADDKPRWLRVIWMIAGALSLLAGFIGIFLPLLPTAPFVLLAAFCFSRGSRRWEQWILDHPRFGPIVRDWNDRRAVPRRAKQLAITMMTISSVGMWFVIKPPWNWMPGLCCAVVAVWLWRLPDST